MQEAKLPRGEVTWGRPGGDDADPDGAVDGDGGTPLIGEELKMSQIIIMTNLS